MLANNIIQLPKVHIFHTNQGGFYEQGQLPKSLGVSNGSI